MPDPFVPTDPYADQSYRPPAPYQPYPRALNYRVVKGKVIYAGDTPRIVRSEDDEAAANAEGWFKTAALADEAKGAKR